VNEEEADEWSLSDEEVEASDEVELAREAIGSGGVRESSHEPTRFRSASWQASEQ
jgi:hypothetical protein